jgi:putative transposase
MAKERFADLQIDLIVDGGSENNNTLVNVFVEKNRKNLQKLIALKDIVFSNSMIEAQFSLMKYNYLYRMKIETQNDLIKAMQFIDNDFNHIRPHSALNGATPDEAYFNSTILPKNQYLIETKEAKTIRIKENKSMKCAKCAF